MMRRSALFILIILVTMALLITSRMPGRLSNSICVSAQDATSIQLRAFR